MKKIFISHSSKDKQMVLELVDFLQLGMGIAGGQIYCTTIAGMPRLGCEFMQDIRDKMNESDVFISVITENYLKSQMCLMELGIAWFLSRESNKLFCPLLAKDVTYERLSSTPIRNIQSYRIYDEDDISSLYGTFYDDQVLENHNVAVFSRKLPDFLRKVNCLEHVGADRHKIIRKDNDGFYKAEIVQVRAVPSMYRCYKIGGMVEIPGENCAANETHWLFYRTGVYQDFKVGDQVKFKIEKTELKDFSDLKNARNIYPARLELI